MYPVFTKSAASGGISLRRKTTRRKPYQIGADEIGDQRSGWQRRPQGVEEQTQFPPSPYAQHSTDGDRYEAIPSHGSPWLPDPPLVMYKVYRIDNGQSPRSKFFSQPDCSPLDTAGLRLGSSTPFSKSRRVRFAPRPMQAALSRYPCFTQAGVPIAVASRTQVHRTTSDRACSSVVFPLRLLLSRSAAAMQKHPAWASD